jgi:hypothetical protein
LVRAFAQNGAGFPAVVPSYLVAVGFGLAAYAANAGDKPMIGRGGIALVALCRSWFIVSYLMAGVAPIAAANVFGALGAWVWASAGAEVPTESSAPLARA